MNSTCTDWFSLPLNATVGVTTSFGAYLCKSRQINAAGQCYGVMYNSTLATQQDKYGLVNCSIAIAAPCGYIDSMNVNTAEACQCSYDVNGGSYCRRAYDEANKDWTNYASLLKTRFSNTKCHTTTRFSCYDVSSSLYTDTYNAEIATVKSHHFKYASECIQKLFNSGEYIRYSFIILAALLINLI